MDGTYLDEPRGTRLAGLVETRPRRTGDAEMGGREDGGERAVGAPVAGGHESEGRWGSGPRFARTSLKPTDRREDSGTSDGDREVARLARFQADVCERATGQAASDPSKQGDGSKVKGDGVVVHGLRGH